MSNGFTLPDELLQLLGRLALSWTHVELSFNLLLCQIIGNNGTLLLGMAITKDLSVSRQIRLMRDICDANAIKEEFRDTLLEIVESIDAARLERNRLLHGFWAPVHDESGKESGIVIMSELKRSKLSVYQAEEFSPISEFLDRLLKLRERLHQLGSELRRADSILR